MTVERKILVNVAYGFMIGLAVGVVLEATGSLAWVDSLVGRLTRPAPAAPAAAVEEKAA